MRLTFEGVVSARIVRVRARQRGDAASDLRRDVARSLRSRLDTFLDEADDALEEEEAHGDESQRARFDRARVVDARRVRKRTDASERS